MDILSVKNLSIEYIMKSTTHTAVSNISFNLKKGQILGIAGESGCGKSTTAKALIGLLPTNARCKGQININGIDICDMNERPLEKVRGSQISMVFQNPMSALNPSRKIKHQFYDILYHMKKEIEKKKKDEIIEGMLKEVHLPEPKSIMNKYPFELSGGMCQRVVIAMALCQNPNILVADEPTASIDAALRKQIVDEFININKTRNVSMIYISHNLSELYRLCDRIAVMYAGKIVEENDTKEIFMNPQHSYTKALIEGFKI